MRNLNVLSSTALSLPSGHLSAIAVDTEEDVIFAASESIIGDNTNIQVWKVDEDHGLQVFSDFNTPVASTMGTQVVSFTVIAETHTLCLVTRSGDIAVLSLEHGVDAPQSFYVVGTLAPYSIITASFSPDFSLLVIITPYPPTLHLMSLTSFTLILSTPLSTDYRGAAPPINVGWGSKATQFHGSLGKGAAQAQSDTEHGCTSSPDDDTFPRVSWRGDAQFFAVSDLEGPDGVPGKRVIRVYNRAGVLQSTAEDVPGLEHVLAWRPSGGLIAAVQRFGSIPGGDAGVKDGEGISHALGKGTDGRHDVVFFERNGLRHGEFSLRESGTKNSNISVYVPSRPWRPWGYRVRELGWNADSSVLGVWMERESYDVVQLWTTGNHHWYLKLELPAPRNGQFTSVSWHTEDPARLFLLTNDTLLLTRYTVSIASSPSSCDTGLVGVIDGDVLMLTPFRTQNVPPPMASARLSLTSSSLLHTSPAFPSIYSQSQTQPSPPPVHITFAPKCTDDDTSDVLAALFTTGTVALWTIRTPHRIKESKHMRQDVVSLSLLWRGNVGGGMAEARWVRQVWVLRGGHDEEWVVGVLGEAGMEMRRDVICFIVLVPTASAASAKSPPPTDTEPKMQFKMGDTGLMSVARTWEVSMPGRDGRMAIDESAGVGGVVWHAKDGRLWEVPLYQGGEPKLVSRLPEFCAGVTRVYLHSDSRSSPGTPSSPRMLFVGLSSSRLHVTSVSAITTSSDSHFSIHSPHPMQTHTLSQVCTSYSIAGVYLVWTSTAPAHEAVFVKLDVLYDLLHGIDKPRVKDSLEKPLPIEDSPAKSHTRIEDTLEMRRIERGSRIVTVVPSTTSLVLQMPRGNLETVMPRPLVMDRVRGDVQSGNYRAAFLACRKHRVDLNALVEMEPTTFMQSIPLFVNQVYDVDHINLFLSGLSRSALPHQTINRLCDGIRVELEQHDIKRFINSILTAHVVKIPPDYEAGLSLLLRLRGANEELVEDAVKYIIFLVDADRLFDTALGMYDFSLVLLVAQYSQKDPQEYLPFLRSLSALEGAYQRFKIDDYLRRYTKALHSLHDTGSERFEEAKTYVEKHTLHVNALDIWKSDKNEFDALLELYGDHLFDRREFRTAALAFVQCSCLKKAMLAYEKALDWQELFNLVLQEGIIGDRLVTIARRVADDLGSKQRHIEAARVLLDYVGDVEEAIASLVKGNAWSETRRIVTLHKRDDLVASLIIPGTLEAQSSILEEVADIRDLLDKQVNRLDELASKRLSQPEAFYGLDEANLANVDVMTDVSNPGTMFTRYTVAATASDRSRRTSRSKRKLDRKAGRKGTIEEEEYLLQSVIKLVVRLEAVQVDCRALLPQLLASGEAHAAKELHMDVDELEQTMRSNVERIWTEREERSSEKDDIEGIGSSKVKIDKVPRPAMPDVCWGVGWIGMVRQ